MTNSWAPKKMADLSSFWGRFRAVPLRAAPSVAARLIRRGWHGRTAPRRPRDLSDRNLLRALRSPLSQAGLVEHFRRPDRPRLLERPEARQPAVRERLTAQAADVLAHRFDLLGSGPTDLGPRIDWRRDFKSGHAWPLEHHSRLALVDLEAGFDVKVPWELSRFHHGVTLAQAYALTSDERYAGEFAAQVTCWLGDNPVEFGPNWGNAMEAAIRAANWLAAYDLLAESPALTPEFHLALLKGLLSHGRYIASHLESGWPGSNHYLADLCGLVWLGAWLPEFKESARWLRVGLGGLERELRRQVRDDGSDYEASTGYHYLVTEMILWTVIACHARQAPVPPLIAERLEMMLDVLAGLLKPDGSLPAFGDLDSGRWLALESDREALPSGQDAQGLLALGASLFGRADWATAAGERREAVEWVAGLRHRDPSPATRHPSPATRPPSPVTSIVFPQAGWFVMHDGDRYLAVDAGDSGAEGWGLHAHNDALSFELAVGGRTFLVDPGSYVYTADYRARNAFRATAAHNTLVVDGAEINPLPERDVFRLGNEAQVNLLRWETDETRDLLVAEHTGYRRLGAIHRRAIYFDKARGFWLLRDRVLPVAEQPVPQAESHEIEIYFHFAPLPVVVEGQAVRTVCADGVNLVLLPVGGPALEAEQQSGWFSPRYGVRLRAPVVRYTIIASLPVEVTFVLWPFEGGADLGEIREQANRLITPSAG